VRSDEAGVPTHQLDDPDAVGQVALGYYSDAKFEMGRKNIPWYEL